MTFQSRRLKLHDELKLVVGNVTPIYFQPPDTKKMTYPCIVYAFQSTDDRHANNAIYIERYEFQVLYITKDPDSNIPFEIKNKLEYCSMGTRYEANGLYHFPLDCSII